jgi:transcriptional regulator with XRE-family HTH domain
MDDYRKQIGNRLRTFREALGFQRQNVFCDDFGGVTTAAWSNYENGGRSLPDEIKERLYKKYGLNANWLLTGEGQMYHNVTFEEGGPIPHNVEFKDTEPEPNLSTEKGSEEGARKGPALRLMPGLVPEDPREPGSGAMTECIDSYELEGARLEGARSLEISGPASGDDVVYVDFFSGQTAGAGPAREIEVVQPITPQAILRRFISPWRPNQIRALEVRGDSMTKVSIFDRDIVLFVPEEKEGDGIFVISIENRMQVKRLEFDILGMTLRIISENDRYQPRVLTAQDEIERVVIEGKVIGVLHRHPY